MTRITPDEREGLVWVIVIGGFVVVGVVLAVAALCWLFGTPTFLQPPDAVQ